MPIVAPWPNMIVVFELAVLGAMWPRWARCWSRRSCAVGRAYYDPAISDGYILVGVGAPGRHAPPWIACWNRRDRLSAHQS